MSIAACHNPYRKSPWAGQAEELTLGWPQPDIRFAFIAQLLFHFGDHLVATAKWVIVLWIWLLSKLCSERLWTYSQKSMAWSWGRFRLWFNFPIVLQASKNAFKSNSISDSLLNWISFTFLQWPWKRGALPNSFKPAQMRSDLEPGCINTLFETGKQICRNQSWPFSRCAVETPPNLFHEHVHCGRLGGQSQVLNLFSNTLLVVQWGTSVELSQCPCIPLSVAVQLNRSGWKAVILTYQF